MTNLSTTRKPLSFAGTSPSTALVVSVLDIRCLLAAVVLPVMAASLSTPGYAQQTAPAATQMPQAPQAPTIEGITTQSTQNARTAAANRSAPEVNARLSLELQQVEGQDTNNTLQRDTGRADVELTLDLKQQLNHSTRLVAQLELSSRRFSKQVLDNSDDAFAYDLERLFVDFKPQSNVRLRAGRQGFDDPMETFVDEDLDGLAITYDQGIFELELSYTRQDWFEGSTFTVPDNITNTLATLQITPNKDTLWMPYYLQRSANNNTSRTWIGLQGIVEPDDSAWRYWIHASTLDGDEAAPTQPLENGETSEASIRDVGGHVVDIGLNWRSGGALKPTYTLAIARATGGSSEDRFRQSGLQGNDFALNGKNSFRYLGEVLDPELTNIQVLTLGAGFKLSKDWIADIALHAYEQVETQGQLRGSDIEFNPEGTSNDLGTGADIVIAYEPNKRLEVKATVGTFLPGDAFDSSRDQAWLARAEFDYRF